MALRAVLDHPKFADLKARLQQPRGSSLGWLEAIWHFTGRFTPQGNIGKYTDREIEAWVEWNGEPGALVAALTDSKWLQPDPIHRILVHDWHEHADKATKQSLKNKKLEFCVPSVRRVGTQLEHTMPLAVQVCDDLEHTIASAVQVCAPPVPEPVPEPEPEPGAVPGPVQTAPPVPPPSPGGNGEFIAAVALLQNSEIPATGGDIRIIAQLVQIEAKHHGGVEGAMQYLEREIRDARSRGEPVTVFWLKDRKYLHTGGSNGTSQPSATKQRVDNNRRAIAEALARRGIGTTGGAGNADGGPLPVAGSGAVDRGVSGGLRAVVPPVRHAEGVRRTGGAEDTPRAEILPPAG